jgi:hypothetical protein
MTDVTTVLRVTIVLRVTTATDFATTGATPGGIIRRPKAATTVVEGGRARAPRATTIAGARLLVASMEMTVAGEDPAIAAMTVVMRLVAVGRTHIVVGTTAGTTGLTSALRALRTERPLSSPVDCRSKDMNVLAWISSLQNTFVSPAENWPRPYIRGWTTCAHTSS